MIEPTTFCISAHASIVGLFNNWYWNINYNKNIWSMHEMQYNAFKYIMPT